MRKLFCIFISISFFTSIVAQESGNNDVTELNSKDTISENSDSLHFNQCLQNEITKVQIVESFEVQRYKLFPTQNTTTFLKLDTRTGRVTHVQLSVGKGDDFEYSLGSPYSSFSDKYQQLTQNGRFTLIPTANVYNFILLDQIDGYVWQVQWNGSSDKRIVRQIEWGYTK